MALHATNPIRRLAYNSALRNVFLSDSDPNIMGLKIAAGEALVGTL